MGRNSVVEFITQIWCWSEESGKKLVSAFTQQSYEKLLKYEQEYSSHGESPECKALGDEEMVLIAEAGDTA